MKVNLKLFRNWGSTLVSLACLILFCFSLTNAEYGSKLQGWKDIVSAMLIFSIAALSLNVVCGCLGEFALGHGGFLLVGFTTAVFLTTFFKEKVFTDIWKEQVYARGELHSIGYLLIIGITLIAAVITGVVGYLVGLISLGRLKGDYLAIVTLGVNLALCSVISNVDTLFGIKFGGKQVVSITDKLSGNPVIYAVFLILIVILILVFMRSRFGRGILSMRDDNIAAEASGIPVNKYKVLAFTFSAIIAGVAGCLLAFLTPKYVDDFNQDMSIKLLIIIVLGGLGSLTGSIIGAVAIFGYERWFCQLDFMPEFFRTNTTIVYGIILVLIMLFRSKGILGNAEFTWNWFYDSIKTLYKKIKKLFTKKTKKQKNETLEENSIESKKEDETVWLTKE